MYGETLVELPVGLMGCCVEADIAGVYMMQRCYTEVLELEDHCKGSHSLWGETDVATFKGNKGEIIAVGTLGQYQMGMAGLLWNLF